MYSQVTPQNFPDFEPPAPNAKGVPLLPLEDDDDDLDENNRRGATRPPRHILKMFSYVMSSLEPSKVDLTRGRGTTVWPSSDILSGSAAPPSIIAPRPNCRYDRLKSLSGAPPNPDRTPPPDPISVLKRGDIIYFDPVSGHSRGHAEMCIGFEHVTGLPLFASDANQGTSFLASTAYTNGTYTIYRNQNLTSEDIDREVETIQRRIVGYTGKCAAHVREAVEAGLGHSIGTHPADAAGYNQSYVLYRNDFTVVAHSRSSPVGIPFDRASLTMTPLRHAALLSPTGA